MTPQKFVEAAEAFLKPHDEFHKSLGRSCESSGTSCKEHVLLRQAITIIRQQQERADAYFLEVRNLRHDAAETSEALDELQETVDELQDLVGCGCDPPKGHWCDEHHPKL